MLAQAGDSPLQRVTAPGLLDEHRRPQRLPRTSETLDEERGVPGLRGASVQSGDLKTKFLLMMDIVDVCLTQSAAQEQAVLYRCGSKMKRALVL